MKIYADEIKKHASDLRYGDKIELSGYIYTARDAAHKRIDKLLDEKSLMPFEIKGAVIYYAGPTPAPFFLPIGACGPTTSCRMDAFSPRLLNLGLTAMIGKGSRSQEVKEAIIRNKAVYFSALGGAGALAAECIKSQEPIAFPELGCESIKRLYIEDFPLIVAVDSYGGDIYEQGRNQYAI